MRCTDCMENQAAGEKITVNPQKVKVLSSQKSRKAVLLKNSLPAFLLDVYAPEIISQTGTGGTRSPRHPFFHRGQSAGPHC